MTMIQPSPTVFVTLRESTVAMLIALRRDGETLDAVVTRCLDAADSTGPVAPTPVAAITPPAAASPAPVVTSVSTWPTATFGFRAVFVLGEPVRANTLGGLLRNVVDAVHDLDPAAIERLSKTKARTRRYVALAREEVHAGRLDLPTLRTRSGWWVSANIGRPDLVRSLRALCAASGLRYGHDSRFPA